MSNLKHLVYNVQDEIREIQDLLIERLDELITCQESHIST